MDKKLSEMLIDLILLHLETNTLNRALAMKLLYEIKTATIEEFSQALSSARSEVQ